MKRRKYTNAAIAAKTCDILVRTGQKDAKEKVDAIENEKRKRKKKSYK